MVWNAVEIKNRVAAGAENIVAPRGRDHELAGYCENGWLSRVRCLSAL